MSIFRSLIIVFLLAVFALPAPAVAAASEARQLLESTINEVLKNLEDPALKNSATQGQVLGRIEKIISARFDFPAFTARASGRAWGNFTPDQQSRLIDAFTHLLRETYLNKLIGYNGETVSYTGEVGSTDGKRVEIQTAIVINGKPVPIAYRMQKKSDWMVYDVIVESMSLTQNFRSQFDALLEKGDVEALIQAVHSKAEEARAKNRQ